MAEPKLTDRLVTFIQGLVTDDQGIEINVEQPASSGTHTGAP